MKLLIVGASGKIGRLLTETALERGHEVRGLVLDSSKSRDITDDNLTVVEGNATDTAVMNHAAQGVDAVISVLGHNRYTEVEMQSNAMRALVAAMNKNGIKRLVSLTGTGVYTAGDMPNLLERALTGILTFVDTKRAQDGIKHVEVLKDSQLDWVVLRTPKHRSGKKVTSYEVTPRLKGFKFYARRPNIVDYLLVLAETSELPDRMPVISG